MISPAMKLHVFSPTKVVGVRNCHRAAGCRLFRLPLFSVLLLVALNSAADAACVTSGVYPNPLDNLNPFLFRGVPVKSFVFMKRAVSPDPAIIGPIDMSLQLFSGGQVCQGRGHLTLPAGVLGISGEKAAPNGSTVPPSLPSSYQFGQNVDSGTPESFVAKVAPYEGAPVGLDYRLYLAGRQSDLAGIPSSSFPVVGVLEFRVYWDDIGESYFSRGTVPVYIEDAAVVAFAGTRLLLD